MDSSSLSKNKCTNKQSNQIKPPSQQAKFSKLSFQLNSASPVFWVLEFSALYWTWTNCHVKQTKLCGGQHLPLTISSKCSQREWLRITEFAWKKHKPMEGKSQSSRTFWKLDRFHKLLMDFKIFKRKKIKQES